MSIAAALDFGGTKLAIGFVDDAGRVLGSARLPTPPEGPAEVARAAADALSSLSDRLSISWASLAGIGSTVPGLADSANGVLRFAPTQGWRDVPFAAMLSEATGLSARIANDVNACALAEQRVGLARGCSNVLWITISTGIGAALVLDGRLFEGPRALAGEIGHMAIKLGGPRCGCGRNGCLQAVASGAAIRKRAIECGLRTAGAREVFECAAAGDKVARAIVDEVHLHVGLALSHAANLLDLDLIVIGGGVAESLDEKRLEQAIQAHAIMLPEHAPAVVRTALRSDAALIGAGLLVFTETKDPRT